VLIENFKVGGLQKLGFDYESLKALNLAPHLLLRTGFGQTRPPYAKRAGYDFLIQRYVGMMSITGERGWVARRRLGVAISDLFTGLYCAVIAIEAALITRERTQRAAIDRPCPVRTR